jgi:hypothetical protein
MLHLGQHLQQPAPVFNLVTCHAHQLAQIGQDRLALPPRTAQGRRVVGDGRRPAVLVVLLGGAVQQGPGKALPAPVCAQRPAAAHRRPRPGSTASPSPAFRAVRTATSRRGWLPGPERAGYGISAVASGSRSWALIASATTSRTRSPTRTSSCRRWVGGLVWGMPGAWPSGQQRTQAAPHVRRHCHLLGEMVSISRSLWIGFF